MRSAVRPERGDRAVLAEAEFSGYRRPPGLAEDELGVRVAGDEGVTEVHRGVRGSERRW